MQYSKFSCRKGGAMQQHRGIGPKWVRAGYGEVEKRKTVEKGSPWPTPGKPQDGAHAHSNALHWRQHKTPLTASATQGNQSTFPSLLLGIARPGGGASGLPPSRDQVSWPRVSPSQVTCLHRYHALETRVWGRHSLVRCHIRRIQRALEPSSGSPPRQPEPVPRRAKEGRSFHQLYTRRDPLYASTNSRTYWPSQARGSRL